MSIQKIVDGPSAKSQSRGRKGMPSLGRRMHYQESPHDRDGVRLVGSDGQDLAIDQALERMGGPEHAYAEVVASASVLETQCLLTRHPDQDPRIVMSAFFAAQARHLEEKFFDGEKKIVTAVHWDGDGTVHAHHMIPDSAEGLRERQSGRKVKIDGRNGSAQDAWNKAWRGDRTLLRVPFKDREQVNAQQATYDQRLETLRTERAETSRCLRDGTKVADYEPDKLLALRKDYSARIISNEAERHEVQTQKIDHFFASRGMMGSLEHLVEREVEKDRNTGEVRMAENAKYGIWHAQIKRENAVERESFRHLTTNEKRRLRDKGLDRELEVVRLKHTYSNKDRVKGDPELVSMQARQAKEIESLVLRNEAAKLQDHQQELLKSVNANRTWADNARGKTGKRTSRQEEKLAEVFLAHAGLLEQRHDLERQSLQAEAEGRGKTAPDHERTARMEAKQGREREDFLDLHQIRNGTSAERMAARERLQERAKAAMEERHKDTMERESDPERQSGLAARHRQDAAILDARQQVELIRDRDQDLGMRYQEVALLLAQGKDIQADAMAERHQAERDIQRLRDPAGVAALELKQAQECLNFEDRRLLQAASGPEREAIRERLQGRAQEATTFRHEAELGSVSDPLLLEAVAARHLAEGEILASRQQIEKLRDRDQAVRDRLNDQLERLEKLPERQLARADAQLEREAIQAERHQAERDGQEARVRAGQEVSPQDKADLLTRQGDEIATLALEARVAGIREQEYDLGGHRREIDLLLLQGKDAQSDLMAERHQAERDLETIRNPENMSIVEARQERERADMADRRLLQKATGVDREVIRDRMQTRAREAMEAKHEVEKQGIDDPLILGAVAARHLAEGEILASRQQVEKLRDRDQAVRDRLNDQLERLEKLPERQLARADAQLEREAIQAERHQAERDGQEARVRAGQEVSPQDKADLLTRQGDEIATLALEARVAGIREQEYDLGGHRREIDLLLLQGKDAQSDLMAERHQAERDLETIRNPENMSIVEARQERERADMADRRLLQKATGVDREVIRDRMQTRAREAMEAKHEVEKQGIDDPLILGAVAARHLGEGEFLASRQQVEKLRDRDQAVRDRLDDRLASLEKLPERQLARAEAQVEREAIQVERHQAERDGQEARVRAGQEVTPPEQDDLLKRQAREVITLGLDAKIADLRDQEGEAIGDRPGRLSSLFQVLTGTSRYDDQAKLAAKRHQLERDKIAALPPDDQILALKVLTQQHKNEAMDLETRKALDAASAPRAKAKIREIQLDRRLAALRAETAESIAGVDNPALRSAMIDLAQHKEDSIRLSHQAALLRDREQQMRSAMPKLLPMRLHRYRQMGKIMDQRHDLETRALTSRGRAQGLVGADPKDLSALKERHAKEKDGLGKMVSSDLARTATKPLKTVARSAVALPAKAFKKLQEAQRKATNTKTKGPSMTGIDAAKAVPGSLVGGGIAGVGKVATTVVVEAAKAALHQARHVAQAVGVAVRSAAIAVVNPLAGAKEAGQGLAQTGKDSLQTAGKDLKDGTKATVKDSASAAKDTAQQGLGALTSAGMAAAPKEIETLVAASRASVAAAARTARSFVLGAITLNPVKMTIGTAEEGLKGALAVGKAGSGMVACKLPLPVEKVLDLAGKIPIAGLGFKALQLTAQLGQGAAKAADNDR